MNFIKTELCLKFKLFSLESQGFAGIARAVRLKLKKIFINLKMRLFLGFLIVKNRGF